METLRLPDGGTLLFQGDSITDTGRNRADPASLGAGYAFMTAGHFRFAQAERRVRFLNRGCGGHRVKDLEARWTEDCVALQPDVLTLLIGINEVWRRYDQQDPTPVEVYEAGYRRLLDRVRGETGARVILLEPFLLPVPPDRLAWQEDLDPKRAVVRRLAGEYGALFLPLHDLFSAATRRADAAWWAPDGVHPSPAGHALIAQALREVLV